MTKAEALMMELNSQLRDDPSLLLDILGMAFYRQTGIWPRFKSYPGHCPDGLSDAEAHTAFVNWRNSPDGSTQQTQQQAEATDGGEAV